MILTSIEKLSKDIGFDIGNSNDEVQADLLNGLCEALSLIKKEDRQMQLLYIYKRLDPKTIQILKDIIDFNISE